MKNVFEILYQDKKYIGICRKINYEFSNDLFQDSIETIISKGWDIQSIYERGELHFFFYKVAYLTFNSNSFKSKYGLKRFHIQIEKYDKYLHIVETYDEFNHEINCFNDFGGDILRFLKSDYEEMQITQQTQDEIISEIYNENYENEDQYYKRNLVKLYIKHGTIRNLAKKTGISVKAICNDLNEYKKELKEKYEKIINSKRIA